MYFDDILAVFAFGDPTQHSIILSLLQYLSISFILKRFLVISSLALFDFSLSLLCDSSRVTCSIRSCSLLSLILSFSKRSFLFISLLLSVTIFLFYLFSFKAILIYLKSSFLPRPRRGCVGQGTGRTLDTTAPPYPEPMDHQLLMAMQVGLVAVVGVVC